MHSYIMPVFAGHYWRRNHKRGRRDPKGWGHQKRCGKKYYLEEGQRGQRGGGAHSKVRHTFQEATREPLVLCADLNNNF